MNRTKHIVVAGMAALVLIVFFVGCGKDKGQLEGSVAIDGSSTVYPITAAVAEEFLTVQPRVRVPVGVSGTGGGFEKFVLGETDINDASRIIKAREMAQCRENGIGFIELPVAYDGISVLVNPANTFVDYLTVAELRRIWEPGSEVDSWNDVRPGWPDQPIVLFGPGTDSGTFDYFTHAINGEEQACRSDFSASEDDNALVRGIAGDENALGFFGYAYYAENTDKLRAIPIRVDDDSPAVAPCQETINDGTYAPLSRPIFIYVSTVAAERPEVEAFVEFYLDNAAELSQDVGYVALPEAVYALARQRFASRTTGSAFAGRDVEGMTLEEILSAD